MRTLLPIPARHVPAIFDALLTAYSVKAEALHHAAIDDAAARQLRPLRDHRTDLLNIDELLEQLDWSSDRRAVEIAGECEVLSDIAHAALSATVVVHSGSLGRTAHRSSRASTTSPATRVEVRRARRASAVLVTPSAASARSARIASAERVE